MANVPLKSLKFPGLDNTYTIPQIDSSLTQEGYAADAKAVHDAVASADSEIAYVPFDTKVTTVDLVPTDNSWFIRKGYIRHAGLSSRGQISANNSYTTYCFKARQDMLITGCDFSGYDSNHWGCIRVSNEEPVNGVGNPWTGSLYDTIAGNTPTSESPASVFKGQWVAVNYYRTGTAGDSWTLHLQETSAKVLQPDIPLTPAMLSYVDNLVDGTVKYVSAQTLSNVQKTQARKNIGAGEPVTIDDTLSVEGAAADAKAVGDNLTQLKSALSVFENDLVGANKRGFNVTAGTAHNAVKGFWPVALKSGTQYSIDLTSDAITGYQLYAYYADGTNERIYSGSAFSNTYTASKDIESFGFYIASSFITASGEVAALLTVSSGFYDKTIKLQDTLEMTHDIVGENILTWPITAGVAISAPAHEIPVVVDSGEAFGIKILTVPYGAVTAVQYFLMYADGTNERIFSSSYSLVYRGIAKKKIKAIRLGVGATGVVATGTCTIITKQLDNSIASKLISEINKNYTIKVVNHRGYHTAPENTISAYILSYKAGFKYVETDVQLTSDGVPVLLHDSTINRTARTATGEELSEPVNISDITYEQALTYDFGIYKGTEYAGTKIPTLREFMLLCKRLSLHPYIEIKPTGFTEEQVKGLVDIVISCGMHDSVTWISQNSGYLAYVSNYCNKCRLGLVVSSVTSDNVLVAADLKTTNNTVFVNSGSITAEAVSLCIGQKLPLEYWTVNTESTLVTIDPYVSGISSDSINVAEYYIDRVLSTGTATWS